MRMIFKTLIVALLTAFPALAQIPAPQINLTGNIGAQGFPVLNNGTLIMPGDANYSLTAQETSALSIKVTSAVSLTTTRNLVWPAGRFSADVENATSGGQSIQVIGASGTGVVIPNGQTVRVWNDGTNFVQVGSAGGGAVSSVFGRTGAVVAVSGDYSVGQVTGAAPLVSPALTGTPTVPTAAPGTNTTQAASTAFVLANSGGTLAGDVTGASGANTVVKINSGSIPASTPVAGYDSSGRPIVTPSQSASQFFAAPCGTSGLPSFRGICNADLPNSSVTHIPGASMFLDMLPQHISGSTIQDQSGNGNNATYGATPPTSTSVSIVFATGSSVNAPAAVNNTRTFEFAINIPPYSIPSAYSSYVGTSLNNGGPTFFQGLYQGSPGNYVGVPGLSEYITSTTTPSTASGAYLPAGIHDIIITLGTSSGDKDRYYFDGVEVGGYLVQSFTAGLMTSGNYVIGATPVLGLFSFTGDLYEFITRTAELTPTQAAQEHSAIAADLSLRGIGGYGLPWNTAGPFQVDEGDSLTSCQSGAGYCWTNNLALDATITPFTVVNLGNPGKTSTAINYSSTSIGTTYCNSNNGPNIATVFDGTNDFFSIVNSTGMLTAATVANQVQLLSAAGCKVFVGTMIDRGNGSNLTQNGFTWQQNKAALDAQIRSKAKSWGAAGILDFAADTTLGCDYCSGSPLTNSSLTSNVVTFTANNAWTAGELVTFTGLTNLTFLNGLTIAVSATGLSSTSFQVPFTHANVGAAAEAGYGTGPNWQTDTTHLTGAGGGYAAMAAVASNAINYALGYTRSNPHIISANTYSMNAVDGAVTANLTGAGTYTLPSCIGQSGAVYAINNPTSFSLTVKNLSSTQPINGTDYSSVGLLALNGAGTVTYTDVPNPFPGVGCHWDSGAAAAATAAVSSVSNSDSTLTISPTTGAVVASLNLAHANTWTATQTFSGAGTPFSIPSSKPTVPAAGTFQLGTDPSGNGVKSDNNAAQIRLAGVGTPGTLNDCVKFAANGVDLVDAGAACGAGGAVSAVSNSDGTLTISPTTGAVVGSLALGHANIWTGTQSINLTGSTHPTLPANTIDFTANVSGSSTRRVSSAFGATAFFSTLRADGTAASPTQVLAGEQIGGINAWAFNNASAYNGPIASMRLFADENQTSSAAGSRMDFITTPDGSTTAVSRMSIEADGGVILAGLTPGTAAICPNGTGGRLTQSGCAGGSGGGGGIDGWSGTPLTFISSTTQYAPATGGGLTSTTETDVQGAASAAFTATGLKVKLNAALGAGATLQVTLRDATAGTTLTCTTPSGGTTCSDTTHSVNVAQGDLIDWQLVSSGTVTAGVPQIIISYAVGTSGVGTTSFASGNLSPLFTTSVATSTTTPSLTFTASTFAAHTFYGNNTASTATPGAQLIGASDWGPNSYITGAGSVNVMTATLSPAATALTAGLYFWVVPNLANTTTTPTLNVNGLGAVTIKKSVAGVISALAANDYVTTVPAHFLYDGTQMLLLNPQTVAVSGSASWSSVGRGFMTAANYPVSTPTFYMSNTQSTTESNAASTVPISTTTGCSAIFHIFATTSNTANIVLQFRKGTYSGTTLTFADFGSAGSIPASQTAGILTYTVTGSYNVGDLIDLKIAPAASTIANNQVIQPTIECH